MQLATVVCLLDSAFAQKVPPKPVFTFGWGWGWGLGLGPGFLAWLAHLTVGTVCDPPPSWPLGPQPTIQHKNTIQSNTKHSAPRTAQRTAHRAPRTAHSAARPLDRVVVVVVHCDESGRASFHGSRLAPSPRPGRLGILYGPTRCAPLSHRTCIRPTRDLVHYLLVEYSSTGGCLSKRAVQGAIHT